MTETTKAAEPAKCPYCRKPIETYVYTNIVRRAYDSVRRKQRVVTDRMGFCSTTCASNYQMSCEG